MNQTQKWAIKLGMTAMLLPVVFQGNAGTASAMAPSAPVNQAKVEVKAQVQPTKQVQSTKVSNSKTNKKITITAYMLNIRQGDSFSSKIVGVARQKQEFNVIRESNGLYQIGENQWVSANNKYVALGNGQASSNTNVNTKKPTTTTNSVASKPAASTSAPKQETVARSSSSVVNLAKQYVGVPYVWAGSSPSGFDCSGFISYVYKKAGYDISRMSVASYWNIATKISSPQPGDLVFFKNTYKSGPSHMGIYIGNNQMIHAGSDGVEVTSLSYSYYKNHFLGYGKF